MTPAQPTTPSKPRRFPARLEWWYSLFDAGKLRDSAPGESCDTFTKDAYWAQHLNAAFRKGWETRDREEV